MLISVQEIRELHQKNKQTKKNTPNYPLQEMN